MLTPWDDGKKMDSVKDVNCASVSFPFSTILFILLTGAFALFVLIGFVHATNETSVQPDPVYPGYTISIFLTPPANGNSTPAPVSTNQPPVVNTPVSNTPTSKDPSSNTHISNTHISNSTPSN